jgi:hypothetical protein
MMIDVGPLDVILKLEKGIPETVMGGIVMVIIVVEVTNTVAGATLTDVIRKVPYSSEVT